MRTKGLNKCEICGKHTRSIHFYEEKFLCTRCLYKIYSDEGKVIYGIHEKMYPLMLRRKEKLPEILKLSLKK
jgi:hypothetical protein